ncbi:acetate kinase [Alteromonas pelagimontana]|uniref:Acetate kinase n=1 Tax=Alteromonas pelagimontana TaxID=1858656 RepID=A0A6M4MER2_9ALTE|nr:acetate/propionate family kinase [Alteromonas pelagimontana]QJR81671.1 acetate kinase [Alteromonas pelagimontana]
MQYQNSGKSDESILVCNAGSGSLEMQLWEDGQLKDSTTTEGEQHKLLDDFTAFLTHSTPCDYILHRVVHMGDVEQNPLRVNDEILALIKHWQPLAPLHNGIALALIEKGKARWPDAQQFVFSDSALYSDLPEHARHYPLPGKLSSGWPIKKYGFHGLAHQSQWRLLQEQKQYSRVITIQLGGGSSLTAWQDGKVLDTTMGFTPTDGVPMTTRSGGVDPNIVLHLIEREHYSVAQLNKLFNHEAGLLGLSGVSGDYRDLKISEEPAAKFAIAVFSYRLTQAIGSLMAVMGGVDAIGFGGGLAENQPALREACLQPIAGLGVVVSSENNDAENELCAIHSENSSTDIWISPNQECNEMHSQFKTYKEKVLL